MCCARYLSIAVFALLEYRILPPCYLNRFVEGAVVSEVVADIVPYFIDGIGCATSRGLASNAGKLFVVGA